MRRIQEEAPTRDGRVPRTLDQAQLPLHVPCRGTPRVRRIWRRLLDSGHVQPQSRPDHRADGKMLCFSWVSRALRGPSSADTWATSSRCAISAGTCGLPGIAILLSLPFSAVAYLHADWVIAFWILAIPYMLGAYYLGPTFFDDAEHGRYPHARACGQHSAVHPQTSSDSDSGPQFTGVLSDLLNPVYGEDALRWSLVYCLVFNLGSRNSLPRSGARPASGPRRCRPLRRAAPPPYRDAA